MEARGSLGLSCIYWLLAWLLAGTFCSLLSVASQRGLQKALSNKRLSLDMTKVPRRLTHDGASRMRRWADTQTSLVIVYEVAAPLPPSAGRVPTRCFVAVRSNDARLSQGEASACHPRSLIRRAEPPGRSLRYHLALKGDSTSPRCLTSGMKFIREIRAYTWFMRAGF